MVTGRVNILSLFLESKTSRLHTQIYNRKGECSTDENPFRN